MGYWNDNEVKETKDDHIELEQLEAECLDELGDVEKSFRERMGAENKRHRILVLHLLHQPCAKRGIFGVSGV